MERIYIFREVVGGIEGRGVPDRALEVYIHSIVLGARHARSRHKVC